MKSLRIILAAVAIMLALPASAQWQWVDKDGRKVFSDQPPPASVPDKNILRRPSGKAGPVAAESAATPAAAPAPKLSGKDKELEDKKKQQEAAAKEQKKAEEEQQAKARADNCERAKAAKAGYDSGIRIARTNAKGEREMMDEAARAAEGKRLQDLIASECSPRPATPSSGTKPAAKL